MHPARTLPILHIPILSIPAIMKSLRFLPLLLLSLLVLSACDSGDDNDTDLVIAQPGTPTTLPPTAPEVVNFVAQASNDFVEELASAGGLTVNATDATLNTRTPITVGTSSSNVSVSVLVNSQGQPTNTSMVSLNGQTFLSTPAADRSITLTDAKSNRLKIQFDSNNRYQSTTFTAGTGTGIYTAGMATRFNTALSKDRDFASKITLEPGLTAAQYLDGLANPGKAQLGGRFGGIVAGSIVIIVNNDDSGAST